MTTRPAALLLALTLTGLIMYLCWQADPGRSENYGGVTTAYRRRMEHAVHLWFDKHGVGDRFVCFLRRESGGNPKAYNDDWMPRQGVAGLLQIAYPLWTANNPRAPYLIKRFWHYRHVTWAGFRHRLSDPVQSIRLAYLVYRHAGLGPWLAAGGC